MPYVTSIEGLGIKKGVLQNAHDSIIAVLESRFGEVPGNIVEAVNAIEDTSVLTALLKSAATADTLEDWEAGVVAHS